jgi:hypothetical protein
MSKYITTEVEIDLDDFTTDELIEELDYRHNHHGLYSSQTETLKRMLHYRPEIKSGIVINDTTEFEIKNLHDLMKLEALIEKFDKLTIEDIERL